MLGAVGGKQYEKKPGLGKLTREIFGDNWQEREWRGIGGPYYPHLRRRAKPTSNSPSYSEIKQRIRDHLLHTLIFKKSDGKIIFFDPLNKRTPPKVDSERSLWKGQFQTPKSKASIRKIDIPDTLIYELRRWKLACPANDHDLVFPSAEGKASCHDNVVKRHFNPALKKAGLDHVSFHSLRHTNASMRIQAGQNIKYIQAHLGHASIMITLDTYGHLFEDSNFNRKQVELFETAFSEDLGKPIEPVRNRLETNLKLIPTIPLQASSIPRLQVAANA